MSKGLALTSGLRIDVKGISIDVKGISIDVKGISIDVTFLLFNKTHRFSLFTCFVKSQPHQGE